jgi:hypothetical protein
MYFKITLIVFNSISIPFGSFFFNFRQIQLQLLNIGIFLILSTIITKYYIFYHFVAEKFELY